MLVDDGYSFGLAEHDATEPVRTQQTQLTEIEHRAGDAARPICSIMLPVPGSM